uniref:Uncharacterized protein n=1 Tax=Meleagris gallopavo TaxID=9103 RepID=A0A803XL81_MELGA
VTSPSSENHLSKPDVRETAKAWPRIPVRGHESSGVSQTTEVDVYRRSSPSCGNPPISTSFTSFPLKVR